MHLMIKKLSVTTMNYEFAVWRSKKTNSLLLADYRHLVQHFCYRCLQMWSADCRRFPSEKTNSTLPNLNLCLKTKHPS
ncbi:hypothetical protein Hanom_Chr12g01110471 [Helianthus anomalus]